jgi:hypothetical protein
VSGVDKNMTSHLWTPEGFENEFGMKTFLSFLIWSCVLGVLVTPLTRLLMMFVPGKLKSLPDHGGNRTRDLWDTLGCTLRVTSQTSYSPEYITPTHTHTKVDY